MYSIKYERIAKKAVDYIENGMTVSLGTGKTASAMIHEVGVRVENGLKIIAVSTSRASKKLAEHYKIPIIELEQVNRIDIAIDGVDEIDSHFNAIKGGGGASYREKINALMSDKVIWILEASKKVACLGSFPLPIEVEPYSAAYVMQYLDNIHIEYTVRRGSEGSPFITENNNLIFDLRLYHIEYPSKVYQKLKNISGVLEVGLFLNLCNIAIVSNGKGVEVLENKAENL